MQEVERLKALLITNEASEKLAEKKLADAIIRAPFPGAIKHRVRASGEYLKVQGAGHGARAGPIACGRGWQCPSMGWMVKRRRGR